MKLFETILQHVYTMPLTLKQESSRKHILDMPSLTARAIIPLAWLRDLAPHLLQNKHTQKYQSEWAFILTPQSHWLTTMSQI